MKSPARLPLVAVVASSLALAACGLGGSSKSASTTSTTQKLTGFAAQSPQAILAATCGATLPVSRVTVDTTFSKPTSVGGISTMHWVMSDAADSGTLTYTLANKQAVVLELYLQAYTSYVKAPASWWATTSAKAQAAALANKWVSISSTSPGAGIIAPFLPYSNLTTLLENCTRPERTPTKGALTAVGKDQVIGVKVNGGFVLETFYVPTMSAPYARKITVKGATGTQSSVLSNVNTAKVPAAPSGAVPFENPGAPKK